MDDYPITLGGDNANAAGDNRLAQGGCFVGRDVHSNPLKDVDGAETPESPERRGAVAGGQRSRTRREAGNDEARAASGAPTATPS